MNWKLIFVLSLFGLAMGFATVFVVGADAEPWAWLGILVVSGIVIAKRAPGKYVLHGLCVGLLNCVWITAAHFALYDAYAAGHAREIGMLAELGSPRTMMLAVAPAFGLASGLVLGVVAWVLTKFLVSSHSDFAGW